VPHSDIVKGYEFEKGRYVVVTDEDIQKVRVESTRVIDLAQFTDETAIDPIYVDRSYYLAPDGPMATDAFAVMREGMAGKVGIGKVALYGREYLVAVRPQKKGLVMYTLHHDAEIRSIEEIDELNSVPTKVKPEEMKLAKQVVSTFDAELNLKDYKDEYKEGLRQIIDAKIAGEEVVAPEVQEPPRVVDLMEALRRSLDSVSAEKKKPAKADLQKAAAAAPRAKAVANGARKRKAG
jgi:DNA end-binding protein Ku